MDTFSHQIPQSSGPLDKGTKDIILRMIVLGRKGFGGGLACDSGSVVYLQNEPGPTRCSSNSLDTGYVGSGSPRSCCQDGLDVQDLLGEMPVKDAGNDTEKGRRPSLGCRSDPSDGEKEGGED